MINNNIKILLVDDREDNLLSMEIVLEKEGYSFTKARSGLEALKVLLKEDDFSLILLDVKMPGIDGYETAELIYQRDKLREVPIIFITAHHYEPENIFKGYKYGGVDYIYKPFNADILRSKVAVFAELYKKNQLLRQQEQKLIGINKELKNEIKKQKKSEQKISSLNKELISHIEKLKSSNEQLESFAFVASHDLQEPLRKIKVFSNRLLEKYTETIGEDSKNYLEKIERSAGRLQMLIKEILAYSTITADESQKINQSLNEVVNMAVSNLEISICEKQANINIEPLPSLKIIPEHISRVFQNLISNSIKFSKVDVCPVINIREEKESPRNLPGKKIKYHHISIMDNGIGFDEKYASKIFGMFQRLHQNHSYDGAGIGLAVCKKIIDQHHAFLSVESKVNEGTKFTISFPAVEETNVM
jgi:signal transduction histidine kinase